MQSEQLSKSILESLSTNVHATVVDKYVDPKWDHIYVSFYVKDDADPNIDDETLFRAYIEPSLESITRTLNKATKPLQFRDLPITRNGSQTLLSVGNISVRQTCVYEVGRSTSCPDHEDWEECQEEKCTFEPEVIHNGATRYTYDLAVLKGSLPEDLD